MTAEFICHQDRLDLSDNNGVNLQSFVCCLSCLSESVNRSTNNQSKTVTRISEMKLFGFNQRRLSSECGQTIDSFLFPSLPLKVAKSPNLRRLSRDLLLEILDAIADYLKESNIAVNSWRNGVLQPRGIKEIVFVFKTGWFLLVVNSYCEVVWAFKPSLAYPCRAVKEERPTEPSVSLMESEIPSEAEVEI